MNDEEEKCCPNCEWRDWEMVVWGIVAYALFVVGIYVVANL